MRETGHVDLAEPFKGLFTQGMVVHETYRVGSASNGRWLAPTEVRLEGVDGERRAFDIATGEAVTIGPLEKMSKSKKNTVSPEDITDGYGADTARWFMLSDSPPERDVEWTDDGAGRSASLHPAHLAPGIDGGRNAGRHQAGAAGAGEAGVVSKAAHKILKAVGEDIEKLAFNRAIARIYELANALTTAAQRSGGRQGRSVLQGACREPSRSSCISSAPVMPHLAEECWKRLVHRSGRRTAMAGLRSGAGRRQRSHLSDPGQRQEAGDLTIARDADQGAVEKAVLALDFVQKALEGKAPRKVIIVPQRIVNVVA